MRRYTIDIGGKEYVIDVQELVEGSFRVHVGGREFEVRLAASEAVGEEPAPMEIVPVEPASAPPGQPAPPARQETPPVPPLPEEAPQEGEQFQPRVCETRQQAVLTAPMPGTIVSVRVAVGDTIQRGQVVFILEAMKMKNSLQSPHDGKVAEVLARAGQKVDMGDVLVRFAE